MSIVFASSFEFAAVATMAVPLIAYIALVYWFSKGYKKISGPVTMPPNPARHMTPATADGPSAGTDPGPSAATDAGPGNAAPGTGTMAQSSAEPPAPPAAPTDSPQTPGGGSSTGSS